MTYCVSEHFLFIVSSTLLLSSLLASPFVLCLVDATAGSLPALSSYCAEIKIGIRYMAAVARLFDHRGVGSGAGVVVGVSVFLSFPSITFIATHLDNLLVLLVVYQ